MRNKIIAIFSHRSYVSSVVVKQQHKQHLLWLGASTRGSGAPNLFPITAPATAPTIVPSPGTTLPIAPPRTAPIRVQRHLPAGTVIPLLLDIFLAITIRRELDCARAFLWRGGVAARLSEPQPS